MKEGWLQCCSRFLFYYSSASELLIACANPGLPQYSLLTVFNCEEEKRKAMGFANLFTKEVLKNLQKKCTIGC